MEMECVNCGHSRPDVQAYRGESGRDHYVCPDCFRALATVCAVRAEIQSKQASGWTPPASRPIEPIRWDHAYARSVAQQLNQPQPTRRGAIRQWICRYLNQQGSKK